MRDNNLFEDQDKVVKDMFKLATGEKFSKVVKRTLMAGVAIAIIYGMLILAFFGTLFYVVGHFIAKWW